MNNPTIIIRPAFPGGFSWLGLAFHSTRFSPSGTSWFRKVETSWMDTRYEAIEAACESIPEPKL